MTYDGHRGYSLLDINLAIFGMICISGRCGKIFFQTGKISSKNCSYLRMID